MPVNPEKAVSDAKLEIGVEWMLRRSALKDMLAYFFQPDMPGANLIQQKTHETTQY